MKYSQKEMGRLKNLFEKDPKTLTEEENMLIIAFTNNQMKIFISLME